MASPEAEARTQDLFPKRVKGLARKDVTCSSVTTQDRRFFCGEGDRRSSPWIARRSSVKRTGPSSMIQGARFISCPCPYPFLSTACNPLSPSLTRVAAVLGSYFSNCAPGLRLESSRWDPVTQSGEESDQDWLLKSSGVLIEFGARQELWRLWPWKRALSARVSGHSDSDSDPDSGSSAQPHPTSSAQPLRCHRWW